VLLLFALALSAAAVAQSFDVQAATDAYLARMPPEQKARSDAYFEGGYWLQLWRFLYTAAVLWLLLASRLSARMRDAAERLTRLRTLQVWAYWAAYVAITALLTFPLTVYADFVREHKYGLATQAFVPWLGDQLKSLLVTIVLGGAAVATLFRVVKRLPRSWPVWGALVAIAFMVFAVLIEPLYIAPLFNTYTKLQDPKVRGPILSLARANGIAVSDVYQVDASRQSNRISANVSGFLGTERITLNDNLLKRCSLEEIESVTAHEMGHYVLNHIYKLIFAFGVLTFVGFAILQRTLDWALAPWGERFEIHGITDMAVLPLVELTLTALLFVLTPVTNSYIRVNEYEADIFGLNAARQPDGFASVALKLAQYRKINPGPTEEWIFYDHPSGRTRIFSAMRWKAENPANVAGSQ
jgi:STE24 endopeptidase